MEPKNYFEWLEAHNATVQGSGFDQTGNWVQVAYEFQEGDFKLDEALKDLRQYPVSFDFDIASIVYNSAMITDPETGEESRSLLSYTIHFHQNSPEA